TDNGEGTFTVRFFRSGVAEYVTGDRFLPTDSSGRPVYSSFGRRYDDPGNELWVALAEKAYAQLNESGWIGQDGTNSYAGIDGGYGDDALRQITGGPAGWAGISAAAARGPVTAAAGRPTGPGAAARRPRHRRGRTHRHR